RPPAVRRSSRHLIGRRPTLVRPSQHLVRARSGSIVCLPQSSSRQTTTFGGSGLSHRTWLMEAA
ncbi:MAG TPA: hypothetical protein VFC12_07640, partial [Terriglobales bacterium]|nr:hypothetical protein [Terriglobales bacterium]